MLSGSRTGLVETLAVVFIAGFTIVNQYLVKKGKSIPLSLLLSIIFSITVTGIFFVF